jgi:hypothetical protein
MGFVRPLLSPWKPIVLKPICFLPFAVAAAWSSSALAQNAPPAAADGDDLELPAKASTVPGAAAAKPTPESSPQHEAASSETSELKQQLTALRARLDALEVARVSRAQTSAPGTTKPEPARAPVSTNLEKNAISRPVPTGLRIGGYLQTQFESNQLSENQLQQGGAPLNQDRFSLRRGRLRLDRGWEYANATLELDANTTRGMSVGIRRAEGSVLYRGDNGEALPPLVMLSLGVTDIPFGFELLESSRVRPFMERSLGSLALFPTEMDVGAKLSGAVSFLRYAFAITNGEPVDNLPGRFPRDPNAQKDYSGRVGVETQPVQGLSISGGTSFYQGTGFHPGTDATKPSFTWVDTNEDRTIQASELQAVPGTAAQPSANFKRWAYALDLELVLSTGLGSTRLNAEGFLASNLDRSYLIADPVLSGLDVREAGGYVALVQDVTKWGQVGFRASFYDPNADFAQSVRGRQVPTSLGVRTLSPLVALVLKDRARLSFQYDFVHDYLAKDAQGVPTDAKNNQLTLRLQVEL